MTCTAPSCRCLTPCWARHHEDGPEDTAGLDEEYVAALERQAEERRLEAAENLEAA